MTHEGVDKLVREAAENRRRIRELESELAHSRRREAALTDLGTLLSQNLDEASARITELEHVEQVAVKLMARLAIMGTVIAHDDAARILAQALAKK
jgi:predicted  nucleic acid-binding Zn-ribbon protein